MASHQDANSVNIGIEYLPSEKLARLSHVSMGGQEKESPLIDEMAVNYPFDRLHMESHNLDAVC